MRTDGRTVRRTNGMTKLIVAFRNFANVPKNITVFCDVTPFSLVEIY